MQDGLDLHVRRVTARGVAAGRARPARLQEDLGRGCVIAARGHEFDGVVQVDLATGEPTNPPATRAVRTYPVKEENGQVYVSLR